MFGFVSNFFSDLLFNLIIPGMGLGLLCIIVSFFIPSTLAIYKIPLQIGGLVLVVFFVFTAGRFSEHKKYEAEAAELRMEIATQTALANRISTDVMVQYVDKVKVVTQIKEVKVTEYVNSQDDQACRIDNDTAIRIRLLLDNAAKGSVPSSPTNPASSPK